MSIHSWNSNDPCLVWWDLLFGRLKSAQIEDTHSWKYLHVSPWLITPHSLFHCRTKLVPQKSSLLGTPPKINIEPDNDGLEDVFPFWGGPYSQVPADNLPGTQKSPVPAQGSWATLLSQKLLCKGCSLRPAEKGTEENVNYTKDFWGI